MHRLVASLLLALLLLPAAQAVDPNPRSEPAMTLDSAITAMAMAPVSGTVVAGRADPTTTSGETPHLWRAWDSDGGLRRSETADKANCSNPVFLDPCLGNVVAVAASADGNRIAIAARDDQDVGRLVFATLGGGIVNRIELTDERPTDVAVSPDGLRVAVASELPAGTGRVRLYGWSGTGAGIVASTWSAATALPATDVAIGPDGRVSASAGDRHYRFVTTGTAVASYMHDTDATLNAVAYAAASAQQWSVAGSSDGGVLLYSSAEETATPSASEDLQQGTSPQGAVAITGDGRFFAAGDASGIVRYYRNLHLVAGNAPVVATTAALPGGVASLHFSSDGKYLVAGAGAATVLFRATDSSLAEVWRHSGSGTVLEVGVNSDGSLVAAAAGSAVTMFTTVRSASLEVAGNGTVQPGVPSKATLTIRNTGNREDTITLDPPQLPTGWKGNLSRTSFTLAPDATAIATLNVTAPAAAAPGTATVNIVRRQASLSSVTTPVGFTVAQTHRWSLAAVGPASQSVAEAGASVRFMVKATNLGNGADTTAVTLDVDRTGWTASAAPATLSAAAGKAAYTNITLVAAPQAQQLDSAAATVRLAADPLASLRLTATVGARFGLTAVASPDDSDGAPGQRTEFTLRITNTGNAPDTFLVVPAGAPEGWTLTLAPLSPTPSVLPGATLDVRVEVTPSAIAAGGNYDLAFTVRSQGDATKSQEAHHTLRLAGADTETESKSSKGSPGPGLVLVAVALAALAIVRRR